MDDSQRGTYPSFPSEGRDAQGPALRDALRALTTGGPADATSLTPTQISELAQRLARSGGAGSADLARLVGAGSPGTLEATGPVGPQSVICSISDIPCAFPGEMVQGIERLADITSVPNTASWVLGVVQLRGVICSVVDLMAFLGLGPTTITNRTRLLVVSHRGMTMGLVVDGVLELRADISSGPMASGQSLAPWLAPYSAGVVEMGGRQVQLVDVQRLMFADKMQRYGAHAS